MGTDDPTRISDTSEPESYEELLREHFDQIRALASEALDMLDAQARGDAGDLGRPGEPTWMVGQIANEVIHAERIISEWNVSDDEEAD